MQQTTVNLQYAKYGNSRLQLPDYQTQFIHRAIHHVRQCIQIGHCRTEARERRQSATDDIHQFAAARKCFFQCLLKVETRDGQWADAMKRIIASEPLQDCLKFILLASQTQFLKLIDLDKGVPSMQLLEKMPFSAHHMA